MRKKAFVLGAVLAACMGFTITAYAATTPVVTLTSSNTLEYTGLTESSGSEYLGDAFDGIAPGDTATQTITLSNQSSHAASFFVEANTLQTLEQINKASGGAYELKLSVGNAQASATSLMDTVAGGYNSSKTASSKGLADVDELADYTYVADIDAGAQTNLYLTLTIDGEGFDSTAATNYSNSLAKLGFNFRAYYQDAPLPEQITKTVVKKGATTVVEAKGEATTVTNYVKSTKTAAKGKTINDEGVPLASALTGDNARITLLIVILACGAAAVTVGFLRRKKEGGEG